MRLIVLLCGALSMIAACAKESSKDDSAKSSGESGGGGSGTVTWVHTAQLRSDLIGFKLSGSQLALLGSEGYESNFKGLDAAEALVQPFVDEIPLKVQFTDLTFDDQFVILLNQPSEEANSGNADTKNDAAAKELLLAEPEAAKEGGEQKGIVYYDQQDRAACLNNQGQAVQEDDPSCYYWGPAHYSDEWKKMTFGTLDDRGYEMNPDPTPAEILSGKVSSIATGNGGSKLRLWPMLTRINRKTGVLEQFASAKRVLLEEGVVYASAAKGYNHDTDKEVFHLYKFQLDGSFEDLGADAYNQKFPTETEPEQQQGDGEGEGEEQDKVAKEAEARQQCKDKLGADVSSEELNACVKAKIK